MSARSRYQIATASSLAFHLFVLILIGLLSGRTPLRPQVLIPIELAVAEAAADSLLLGAGGHPEAAPKDTKAPAAAAEPAEERPSSRGGRAEEAPAPPKLLTSEAGEEPAGPEGVGEEPAGEGGAEKKPAGPTRGPSIVGGPTPIYPKDALDRGLEGEVTLSVLVAADGSVSSVEVAKTSGHALLDLAAIRAVEKGWAFKRGLKEGEPAAGKVPITFVFSAAKVESK